MDERMELEREPDREPERDERYDMDRASAAVDAVRMVSERSETEMREIEERINIQDREQDGTKDRTQVWPRMDYAAARTGQEREHLALDRDLERIEVTEGAYKVIDVLHREGNADLVGGCVRDAMLGMKPKDEDITTNLTPDRVTDLFEREGLKVIPTGIEHGTVTVMIPGKDGKLEGYEITTYRIDGASSDQRHPDSVSFTDDIREDMSRRDFTINAMAFDPRAEGEYRIKDFYGGREDLEKGIIRTVGNPEDRIKEDALRMMRAVRFCAQKDMEADDKLKDAIRDNAKDIERVSKERINMELTKILESDRPGKGIGDLRDLGLLRHIAPALDREYDTEQNNPWHLYDVGRHTERVVDNTPNDKETRLAALLHDVGKPDMKSTDEKGIDHFYGHPERSEELAREIMQDLRFTKDEIKETCQLIRYHDERLDPDRESFARFMERHQEVSIDTIGKLIDLQRADRLGQNTEMHGDIKEWYSRTIDMYEQMREGACSTADLALSGRDIMDINRDSRGDVVILYGKDIAMAKDMMYGCVLRDPSMNNREDLAEYLRNNMKNIKNTAIDRMDDGHQKTDARVAFRERMELNKIERQMKELDHDRLEEDLRIYESRQEKGEELEKAEKLAEQREVLLDSLRGRHSARTPALTRDELRECDK